MTTTTIETLDAALAGVRAEYVQYAKEQGCKRLAAIRAKLAENGMDMDKAYPRPSGLCGKSAYRAAEAARSFASRFFKGVAVCRGFKDPYIVAEKPDALAIAQADFVAQANASVDGYVAKLAGKIGKEISSAEVSGNLWNGSRLTVACADGEVQTWETKCIINQSCLGKLFNQWPTRRAS